jgi:hypothetical protein
MNLINKTLIAAALAGSMLSPSIHAAELPIEYVKMCGELEEVAVVIYEAKQAGVPKSKLYVVMYEEVPVENRGLYKAVIDDTYMGNTPTDLFDACIAGAEKGMENSKQKTKPAGKGKVKLS